MLFTILVFILILVILTVIIYASYQSYVTLDKIRKIENERNEDNVEKQEKLKDYIQDTTGENQEFLKERLQQMKDEINKIERSTQQKIKTLNDKADLFKEKTDMIEKQYSTSNEMDDKVTNLEDKIAINNENVNGMVTNLEDQISINYENVNGMVKGLKETMEYEVDILNKNVNTIEESLESLENDYMDVTTFNKFTEKEIDPMHESVKALKRLINSNMLNVSKYILNVNDKNGLMKIRDPSNKKGTDGIDVNNVLISKDGALSFDNSLENPYEFGVKDETFDLNLPPNSSFNIKDDSSGIKHSFDSDGRATHDQLNTKSISIGRFSLMEEDGELTVIERNPNQADTKYVLT